MDMFSLLSVIEDGKKDKQVKKRRTEVLAVGIAEDDDGANAEDERGEAEETCSEQAQQAAVKKKKEKKKEKKKKKKGKRQLHKQFNRKCNRQFNRQCNTTKKVLKMA